MRKLAFLVLALPLLFGFADTGGVGEGGDVGFTPPGGGGGGPSLGLLLVDGTDPVYLVNGSSGLCLVAGGC